MHMTTSWPRVAFSLKPHDTPLQPEQHAEVYEDRAASTHGGTGRDSSSRVDGNGAEDPGEGAGVRAGHQPQFQEGLDPNVTDDPRHGGRGQEEGGSAGLPDGGAQHVASGKRDHGHPPAEEPPADLPEGPSAPIRSGGLREVQQPDVPGGAEPRPRVLPLGDADQPGGERRLPPQPFGTVVGGQPREARAGHDPGDHDPYTGSRPQEAGHPPSASAELSRILARRGQEPTCGRRAEWSEWPDVEGLARGDPGFEDPPGRGDRASHGPEPGATMEEGEGGHGRVL